MKIVTFCLLLCVMFTITGCQSYNSVFEEPKLSFNSVDIAGISLSGVDLIARINVENPNGFSIPTPHIDWELFVNSNPFMRGEMRNTNSLRSRRTTTINLPLNVSYDNLYNTVGSLIGEYSDSKEASYNIALGLKFSIPMIQDKVFELDFSGQLPLPQLPRLSPGSVGISRADYSALVLAYAFTVQNPNLFPIPFPEIEWDYGVNGIPVAKGSLDAGTGVIAAGAEEAANINVSINYADIFEAVSSARNAGEARSNLSLDTASPFPVFSKQRSVLDIPWTIPILQRPNISFQGISRVSLGTTMQFVINLEVDNKNNFSYDIGELNYNIVVNGRAWAQGRLEELNQVRAGARTTISIPVSISAPAIVRELVDIINRGSEVHYEFTGYMSLLGGLQGVDRLEFPLQFQGNTRIR